MKDSLGQLLAAADKRAGDVRADAGALAARVRQTARRRRTVRRASAAGAGVMLIAFVASVSLFRNGESEREEVATLVGLTDIQAAAVEAEIEALRRQAESAERMVVLIGVAQNRPKALPSLPAALDLSTELLVEHHRAAAILEYDADRLARDADRREAAIEEYHRLVQLFPETASAQRARQRLEQMRS